MEQNILLIGKRKILIYQLTFEISDVCILSPVLNAYKAPFCWCCCWTIADCAQGLFLALHWGILVGWKNHIWYRELVIELGQLIVRQGPYMLYYLASPMKGFLIFFWLMESQIRQLMMNVSWMFSVLKFYTSFSELYFFFILWLSWCLEKEGG